MSGKDSAAGTAVRVRIECLLRTHKIARSITLLPSNCFVTGKENAAACWEARFCQHSELCWYFPTCTKSEFSDCWFHFGRGRKGVEEEDCFFSSKNVILLKKIPLRYIWLDNRYTALKNTTLNQSAVQKAAQQQTNKLGSHLEQGHLTPTAFTSLRSSQRQSSLSHTDILWDTCSLRSWTSYRLIHIPHILNDQWQSTPQHPGLIPHPNCLFSTSLHPSHCFTNWEPQTFMCFFSILLQRTAKLLWWKGNTVPNMYLGSLGFS